MGALLGGEEREMNATVKFNRPKDDTAMFLGRNGYFTCVGVEIFDMTFRKVVEISPITSKGKVGRCYIQIPIGNLPEVIEKLSAFLPKKGRVRVR